jgi:hypothetical protein
MNEGWGLHFIEGGNLYSPSMWKFVVKGVSGSVLFYGNDNKACCLSDLLEISEEIIVNIEISYLQI